MRRRTPRAERDEASPAALPFVQATAVRMLARREYGRAELAQRLIQRGAAPGDVDRALDELTRLGYLSDARYAQAVVTQKTGRCAKRAIAHALKQKGIAQPAAEEAMAALAGTDELADALTLWRGRFDAPPANQRQKARQVRFLLSRGYSTSVAFKVIKAASTQADPEHPGAAAGVQGEADDGDWPDEVR